MIFTISKTSLSNLKVRVKPLKFRVVRSLACPDSSVVIEYLMDFDPFFEAVIITISSAKLEVIVKVVRPEESFLAVRFASGSASIPSESITVVITLGVGATADGCAGQSLACKTIWPSQHKMGCGAGAIGAVGAVVGGLGAQEFQFPPCDSVALKAQVFNTCHRGGLEDPSTPRCVWTCGFS